MVLTLNVWVFSLVFVLCTLFLFSSSVCHFVLGDRYIRHLALAFHEWEILKAQPS